MISVKTFLFIETQTFEDSMLGGDEDDDLQELLSRCNTQVETPSVAAGESGQQIQRGTRERSSPV